MADWPLTLPQELASDAYQETFPDIFLRTSMEVGPAKSRRKVTTNVVPITSYIILSLAQTIILDAFYQEISGGATSFSWTHPRLGTTAQMRFTTQPIYSSLKGSYYKATLNLEILPNYTIIAQGGDIG